MTRPFAILKRIDVKNEEMREKKKEKLSLTALLGRSCRDTSNAIKKDDTTTQEEAAQTARTQ
jgi:hypothetical protein